MAVRNGAGLGAPRGPTGGPRQAPAGPGPSQAPATLSYWLRRGACRVDQLTAVVRSAAQQGATAVQPQRNQFLPSA